MKKSEVRTMIRKEIIKEKKNHLHIIVKPSNIKKAKEAIDNWEVKIAYKLKSNDFSFSTEKDALEAKFALKRI